MPLTNCEIKLPLTWSENCALTSKAQIDKLIGTGSDENPQFSEINNPTYATFKITDTKLYVQVVTLSAKDDNNLLEQLKSGFKRTTKWNKCTSEITHQPKTNHVNHLIDPTFIRVNRLFVLSFENEKDRTCFSNYYVPKVEIEDFNVLIAGESFFDVPVKNKEEAYKKIMSIDKNNHYTTGNILDYEYFSKNCTLIAIDLRKQMMLISADREFLQFDFDKSLTYEMDANNFKCFSNVSCIYDKSWWVAIVTEANAHEGILKVEFLHPHGPRKTF